MPRLFVPASAQAPGPIGFAAVCTAAVRLACAAPLRSLQAVMDALDRQSGLSAANKRLFDHRLKPIASSGHATSWPSLLVHLRRLSKAADRQTCCPMVEQTATSLDFVVRPFTSGILALLPKMTKRSLHPTGTRAVRSRRWARWMGRFVELAQNQTKSNLCRTAFSDGNSVLSDPVIVFENGSSTWRGTSGRIAPSTRRIKIRRDQRLGLRA